MKKPDTRRQPGRPADGRDSRRALLDAARQAFVAHGFRGASLRRIAEHAGVTPAMAHYHFKDKAGLYVAVIQETAEPLLEKVAALTAEPDAGTSGIRQFFQTYMEAIAAHPELPSLLLRDVLSEDAPMRETFVQQFATRGGQLIGSLILREQQAGRLDANLNPQLLALSMLSLALFPFLAAPIVEKVLGFELDEKSVAQLIRHNQALFFDGASRKPEEKT